MPEKPQCLVIGAGIIGVACGIELLERGFSVSLIDPKPPGSMTSSGNAGGFGVTEVMPIAGPGVIWRVPGWLFDPYGPLAIRWQHLPSMIPWLWRFHRMSNQKQVDRISRALGDLLQRSMEDSRVLVSKGGLDHLLTEKGALTVYRTRSAFEKDRLEWQIKQSRGIQAEELDQQMIRDMEPALHNANYGWLTPQWCNTTNPYSLTLGLADCYQNMGGEIIRGEVREFDLRDRQVRGVKTVDGKTLQAERIVVAAGVWSRELCHQLGEKVLMESERGYNATLTDPGVRLERQIIFGEEKFVVSNIDEGLRIGGAAEFAGIHAPPNYERSRRLVKIARRYLPGLQTEPAENWMGHRPSTPDSMPVIGMSGKYQNVYHAFGHGHLGLTLAATTAKLIGQLIGNESPSFDLPPFSIERFN